MDDPIHNPRPPRVEGCAEDSRVQAQGRDGCIQVVYAARGRTREAALCKAAEARLLRAGATAVAHQSSRPADCAGRSGSTPRAHP